MSLRAYKTISLDRLSQDRVNCIMIGLNNLLDQVHVRLCRNLLTYPSNIWPGNKTSNPVYYPTRKSEPELEEFSYHLVTAELGYY